MFFPFLDEMSAVCVRPTCEKSFQEDCCTSKYMVRTKPALNVRGYRYNIRNNPYNLLVVDLCVCLGGVVCVVYGVWHVPLLVSVVTTSKPR